MHIWLLSDHSTRTVQAREVALRLGGEVVEISTLQIARSGWPEISIRRPHPNPLPHPPSLRCGATSAGEGIFAAPDIIIGAGEAVAPFILQAKQKTGGKAVCILDPRQNHEQFDLLVLPDWEPLPNLLSIATISCLINHVTPELLAESPLPSGEGWVRGILNDCALQPITPALSRWEMGGIALLVGGRHVGGNITPDDVNELAIMLNSTNQQLPTNNRFLISTSRRTEAATVDAVRQYFNVRHCEELRDEAIQTESLQTGLPRRPDGLLAMTGNVLYNFNADSNMGNPYLDFMAVSDGIIVSGDSVRMVSEACSSGKPVWIWNPPSTKFNPYAKLHENLVAIGAARMFTGDLTPYVPNTLREADRIAAIIRDRLLS